MSQTKPEPKWSYIRPQSGGCPFIVHIAVAASHLPFHRILESMDDSDGSMSLYTCNLLCLCVDRVFTECGSLVLAEMILVTDHNTTHVTSAP